MTFVAIRSVDHCALDGIPEMSSPGEYPSKEIQKVAAVGRGPEWNGGAWQEGREASSKSRVTGSSGKRLCWHEN